jgi:hypothetical protein
MTRQKPNGFSIREQRLHQMLIAEAATAQANIDAANQLLAQLTKLHALRLNELLHPDLDTKIEEYIKAVRNLEGGLADEAPREKFDSTIEDAKSLIAQFDSGMQALPQLLNIFFPPGTLTASQDKTLEDLSNRSRDELDSFLRGKFGETTGSQKLREKLVKNFESINSNKLQTMGRVFKRFITGRDLKSNAQMIADGLMSLTVGQIFGLISAYSGQAATQPTTASTMPNPQGGLVKNKRMNRNYYPVEQRIASDLKLDVKSGKIAAMRNIIDWLLTNKKIEPEALREAIQNGNIKILIDKKIFKNT